MILIVLIYQVWETSRNKLKKHSVTKNCSNVWIKSFSRSLEQFFLTVGQNNFGNKIPFILSTITSFSWDLICTCLCSNANFKSNFEIFFSLTYYLDPRRPNGYLVAAWIITGEFLLIGLSIVGFVCLRRFKRREDWNNKKNLHNYLQGHLNNSI